MEASRDRDQSLLRYEALLEAIDATVWEGDPVSWTCSYVSPGAERMLGYPLREWTEDPTFWLRIIPDDEREATLAEISRQAFLGPVQQLEFRVRAADGRLLWMRNSMRVETDAAGRPVKTRGVMVDITEMKLAQRRLEESQERLSSIFDAVGEGLMLYRRDGSLVDLNLAAQEILGMTARELGHESKVRPRLRIIDEAGQPIPISGLPAPRTFRTGEPVRNYAAGVVRPDGALRWLRVNTGPITDADGRVQYVVLSLTDITEGRKAETERAMLWQAVGSATAAMGIISPSGLLEYVNDAFSRQVGHPTERLIGSHIASLAADIETSRADRESVWQALTTGQEWHGELQNVRGNGEHFWNQLSIAPVRDVAGVVQHFVFVSDDVTQRHSLEAQLRQAQKLESIGRLAGGIAHDFNNLLTAIINYSAFVADGLDDDDPLLDDVKEVMAAGRRAASLTSQLLAFSRKQIVEPRLVDVNATILELDRMLRRLLGSDIELVTMAHSEVGMIWIDPGQLEQVIVNMAVNARDAMPEGGKLTLETSSTTRRAGGRSVQFVQIAITDTGVGMSAEVMEQVFEPFFTTKDSGKGTGLGLATCYGIVTQADGSIEVASKQGVGTRFDVLLPTAAAGAEEKAGPEGGADIPQGLETILVVDDEPLVRNLATRILRKAGYYVSAASGPDEALAAAAGQQVDLLLTDIVMPRTNGRALAKAFVSQSPGTRVLYMSGYADDTALREEIASGEAAFLQKPFVAGDLATKVREVLDAT